MQYSFRIYSRQFSWILIIVIILCSFTSFGQQIRYTKAYKPSVKRVLVLLDGSGSMKEEWEGVSKFETAKILLVKLVDSIQKADPKVQVGIRIFGHQSHRDERNCKDSKLEVPFGSPNANAIKNKLTQVNPQGWTPIAYSLMLASKDFPEDINANNALILITDGLETCGGNPCDAGKMLQDKRISLKPFIIGLGLAFDEQKFFDCVGDYFNVTNAIEFKEVLDVVLTRAVGKTTTQVYLLDINGKPSETNVEMTIYDSYTGNLLYNFIHTMDRQNLPDTIFLNPKGRYDIVAHTIPPVIKQNIELEAGKHNIIKMNTPQGSLAIYENTANRTNSITPCIVKKAGSKKTLFVQDINNIEKYLIGRYDVDVLTLPVTTFNNIPLKSGNITSLKVDLPGTLSVISSQQGIASIYTENEGLLQRVYEFKDLVTKQTLKLQPGSYLLVFRSKKIGTKSTFTQRVNFKIESNKTNILRF